MGSLTLVTTHGPASDNARAVADGMDKASNRVQKVGGQCEVVHVALNRGMS